MAEPDTPQPPRPGSQGSAPTASEYTLELPYAEELQTLLEGRYIVESFLGQGGMGAVYRGLQMPLKRPVAIKILQKRQAGTEDDYAFEERFKREAYAMASLTHPNIVQVYDCGDAGENFLFISMELVEGGDLSDAIKEKQVTPELALKYIVQICDGLEAAHERGLVHRDIKPANIFLTGNGRAKVADFGLAKQFDAKNTMLTKTGLGMGTPDYAAPEQYEGATDLDHRADIYALGVMFYQMLTGKLPRGVYKPASKRVAVDARLDAVIDKAMDTDRTQRYQRVSDMKADIEQIVATWMAGAQEPQAIANTGAVPSHTGAVPANTSRVPLPRRPVSHPPRRAGAVPQSQPTPETEVPETKKRSAGMVAGAMFGAVALIALGAFMVLKKGEPVPQPPGTTVADSSAVDEGASTSAPASQNAGISPSVASAPTPAATTKARFSSFVPGATWRDGFAAPEKWDDRWQRVGTEMHIVGQASGMFTFSEMAVNAGLRVRFRSQRKGAYLDLIQRHTKFSPGPRYLTTMWTNEKLSGSLDIIPPKDAGTRHRIASFTRSPAMGTGVEHTAELYAIGDQVTFFFDGEQLSSVRNGTLADGFAGVLAAPGIEVISLEMATLEPSASGPGMPVGEPLTFGGHRYQHFADSVGWAAAKVRAEAAGGHLATITSKEENDWIVENYISKLAAGGPGVWIGGESKGTKGEWRWVTKEPFGFTRWAQGEPQNVDHEYALMFMNKAQGGPGWTDMNPTGVTGQDRRGGLLVEWDEGAAPRPAPIAKAAPKPGTINLLQDFDVVRDKIEGSWVVRNGELHAGRGSSFGRVAFAGPVPAEYDLRVSFTRTEGNSTVSVHVVLADGQDVMYLMGGFGNKFFAWERVGEKIGNANPTTVPMGIENHRRYECLVKVRKSRLQVEFEGKVISDYALGADKLDVAAPWRYPDRSKLGVGCQQPTIFHAVVLIPFTDSAPIASAPPMPVSPPPPVEPAKTAAPLVLDPRLEQLAAGFKTRYETDAEKPYQSELAKLEQSYVNNGIGRAKASAQQRGLSDELAALEAEGRRVQNHEPLPPTDPDSLPASLKQLRSTYRTSLAKLEAERARKAAPLYDLYLAALDGYVGELTKADKIEQARKAQAVRDEVATKKTALLGDATAVTSADATAVPAPKTAHQPSPAPGTSAGSSPIPPEVLAPPQKGKRTRELIEWVMKRPTFRIGYSQGNNRFQASESDRREIPNSANIWLIDIGNQAGADGFDPSWLEGATDLEQLHLFQLQKFESLLVLRGMKKLQTLRITGNPQMLDDEAIRFLPPLPNLTLLEILGAFSNEGLRIICERCPKLDNIALNQRFTEGGLSPLARLKGLKRATFNQGEVPGRDIEAMGALPNLEALQISGACKIVGPYDLSRLTGVLDLTVENASLTDAEIKNITVLKRLTALNLNGNKGITDAAVVQLTELTKLVQLRLWGCGLKNLGGAAMPVFPALELCHIHGNAMLGDEACAGLARQKSLKSIFLAETSVGDAGVQVLCENLRDVAELNLANTKVTDGGLAALHRMERLNKVWLDGTAITDASVGTLRKLGSLNELFIRNTSLSSEAIAALKKALPKCSVISE